jgi:hypothetical protein
MQTVLIDNLELKLKACKRRGEYFTLESTNYTQTLKTETVKYVSTAENRMLPYKVLGLMQKFKTEVEKNKQNINVNELAGKKIDYQAVNPELWKIDSITREKIYGIDLNRAYENAFYDLGLISSETLNEILSLEKKYAKKVCGVLATTKHVSEYDGNELKDFYKKENKELKEIYLTVVKYVDYVMKQIAKSFYDNFLFYHVDCIYIDTDQEIDNLINEIKEYNFSCKVENYTNFKMVKKSRFFNVDMFNIDKEKRINYGVSINYLE